jgi:stage II sporulation protein D
MSQYGAYGYALHGADYRTILAHYYQGTALGHIDPDHSVRVLVASGTASFTGASAAGPIRLSPATTYSVAALGNGSLAVRNSSGRTVGTGASPLTVTGSSLRKVPGAGSYRGELQFRPDGSGGVETVNVVGLDDYVRGVVSAEMPSSWSPAALQAQAVAARTYAITTTVGASGYDLYDDTRSQMYGGVGAETASTDAAVTATSGQIVTYAGKPAVTYFFASSGGHTENIEDAWPGSSPQPWLRGVTDPYDGAGGDPYHRWGLQMSLPSAATRLGHLVRGSLTGIMVTKHGVSPRIIEAKVVGSRGQSEVSGAQLQSLFGLTSTYATFTTISTVASSSGRTLSGSVYPVPAHGTVSIQEQAGRSWHTVLQAATQRGGRYSAAVSAPGRYRVGFIHLGGPAVTVH